MSDNGIFKTTLMGGYDKDDVTEQFNTLKDAHASIQTELKKNLTDKDAQIADLTKQIADNTKQREKLERDITDKYQKYIDHHNSISGLLVDAQIKADEIINDAEKTRDHMLEMTEAEIKRKLDTVQTEVDEKIAEGEHKHEALQGEIDKIMELINQAQKRFMSSYKEVHKIISDLPKKESDNDDESNEDEVVKGK
jgi:hypothetical protein